MPPSIPFKETLCILAAKKLDVPVKVTTDVLRVAVYMSGGDISLPAVPKVTAKEEGVERHRWWRSTTLRQTQIVARNAFKFRKFNRPERRFLVELLSKTNINVADMQRHLGRWLRLGHGIHVGDFAKSHPKVVEAFRKLREQPSGEKSAFTGEDRKHVRTFNGEVDMAFSRGFIKGVDLLSTRAGEFARRLDWMLRPEKVVKKSSALKDTVLSDAQAAAIMTQVVPQTQLLEAPVYLPYADRVAYVMEVFGKVGHAISSKVLFEMYTHFQNRLKTGAPRLIRLKSKRSKVKALPPLDALSPEVVAKVQQQIMEILHDKARTGKPMGKVFIDERLKTVPLPFSMRSLNTSIKTYVRGTRIPFRADE
jgi:hypothetical protein